MTLTELVTEVALRFFAGGLLELLQVLVPTVMAAFMAFIAIATYFDARQRELKWQRTQFLFEQAKYIEEDVDCMQVIRVLEGREPGVRLSAVFSDGLEMTPKERDENRQRFDKFLNFLDRIAYAVLLTKAINLKEVIMFGWYLEKINESEELQKYCRKDGYPDVVRLAEKLHDSRLMKKYRRQLGEFQE